MVITFLLRKNGDGWLAEQVDMHDVFRRPADVQQCLAGRTHTP